MKKSIILLLFFVFSLSGFSQLAKENDRSLTFNITGLVQNINLNGPQDPFGNSIVLHRYFIKDNLALRSGLGFNGLNTRISNVDSVGVFRRQFDSSSTKFDLNLNVGIEKFYEVSPKILAYFGTSLHLSTIGDLNTKSNTRLTDTTGTRVIEVNSLSPGGFSFGATAHFGFQYFIAERLSLGAEYYLGYFSSRMGGDFSNTRIDNPITGAPQVDRTVGSNLTRTRGVALANSAQIHLTYFFDIPPKNKKK